METDTKRVYKSQPGHPRSCNVCAYYKFFFDDWEHYWELCRKAEIGCNDKKKLLAVRVIERFEPVRERQGRPGLAVGARIMAAGAVRAHADVARNIGAAAPLGGPRATRGG